MRIKRSVIAVVIVVCTAALIPLSWFVLETRTTRTEAPIIAELRANGAHIDCRHTGLMPSSFLSRMKLVDFGPAIAIQWSGPAVTDEDVPRITTLRKLSVVNLMNSSITDDGVNELSQLKNLRTVILLRTSVSEEAKRRLQRSLPDATIYLTPDWAEEGDKQDKK